MNEMKEEETSILRILQSKQGLIEGESPARIPNWKLKESPNRPDCVPSEEDIPIYKTENKISYVRTPEERFMDLHDFSYEPHYVLIDGLRMHYIDEGSEDGEEILMLHGQPSWSYLYRKMIPGLVKAGYRVIAVDHIGMGRSDKPIELGYHTYEKLIVNIKQFIKIIDLKNITLFCQDWGGLVGLRVVGDQPDSFSRVIAANTRLPILPEGMNPFRIPNPIEIDCTLGDFSNLIQKVSTNQQEKHSELLHLKFFQGWILYCLTAPNLKPSQVLQYLTQIDLNPEELKAYDAPFPSLIYKAAIRTFPSMIAAVEQNNVEAWKTLGTFNKPFLFLGGEFDRNMGNLKNLKEFKKHIPGAKEQAHQRYPNAGHFIQDDIGIELANKVISFIKANPLSN